MEGQPPSERTSYAVALRSNRLQYACSESKRIDQLPRNGNHAFSRQATEGISQA